MTAAAFICASKARAQRWWVFRYGAGGRRYHGLGPVHTLGLAAAREEARRCRALLLEGADPISAGRARRAAVSLPRPTPRRSSNAPKPIMRLIAPVGAIGNMRRSGCPRWRPMSFPPSAACRYPRSTLAMWCARWSRAWTKIPETASRLRSRIEAVLDWARVHGYRGDGANPARWRGHLDHLLPDRKRVARVVHHKALSYRDVPHFVRKLRARDEIEARALEFVLLTAARAGEACGADVGGNRSCRRCLDRPRRAHEEQARAPRPARACRLRHPRTDAARAPAWLHLPERRRAGETCFRH